MRPKKPETTGEGDLFRARLEQIIAYQEQRHKILEVRWMPPRADDRSKAVELGPGE